MNAVKEQSTNKGERADTPTKGQPQQNHSDDKRKKDMNPERRPEVQMPDPKEFAKKDNKNYSNKSETFSATDV